MKKPRVSVVVRWLLACALAVWTARQATIAGTTTVEMVGVLRGFFALAGLLVTVLLAAPEVVGWAMVPLHRMVDAVLLPSESEPPVDYTLAHFYRRQMRYGEAGEEYLKIIRYHPRERRAYLEGIDTAGRAGDAELAHKLHRLGQRNFRSPQIRRQLQAALEGSRLTIALAAETEAAGEAEAAPLELAENSPPPEPSGDLPHS